MRRLRAVLLAGVLAVATGCTGPGAPTLPNATPTVTTALGSAVALMPTGLVAAQPLRSTFSGLTTDGAGVLWWTGPGVTRYDPASGVLRTFTIADDAVFGDVRALAPAASGGVWLVTSTALLLFDGQWFEQVIPTPAPMGDVAEAPDATVWTADDSTTGAGVWSWNGSTWHRLPGGRPGSAVVTLTVDSAGRVWATYSDSGQGVAMWNGASWTTYGRDKVPLSGTGVYGMTATPDGSVWLGGDTPGEVARFSAGRWTGFAQKQTGMDSILSIAQEPGGAVWFGGGPMPPDEPTASPSPVVAARFDGSSWTRYGAANGLRASGTDPTAEVAVAAGKVWAGTDVGLFAFTGRGWRLVLANPPGPDPVVRTVVARGADDVWVVHGDLLWHHTSAGWSTPARTGRLTSGVGAAALGADGTLWVGTGTGLTHLDATGWIDTGPGVPISGVTVAPDGTVWAGTARELMHLDGNRVLATVESPDPGLTNIAVGLDGDVWATGDGFSEGLGPLRLHDGTMQTTTPVSGRSDVTSSWVTVAPDGAVWASLLIPVAGTTEKAEPVLARYALGTWTVYRDLGLGDWDRPQLSVGPDGTVYAASYRGLFTFDGATWTMRLRGNWIAVSAAADGTLWLTGDTVYRIPPHALDDSSAL